MQRNSLPSNKTAFPVISNKNPLILASASPRRKRLLVGIRLPFKQVTSMIDETDGEAGWSDPAHMTLELSRKKALDVFSRNSGSWVLGADTIVVIDNRILGKPENEEAARRMLSVLSGRRHTVITGFSILDPSGGTAHTEAVTTQVEIKRLGSREIEFYIGTGEGSDKAGSYAIQGIGSFMVKAIFGSYSNVVGLPLCEVTEALVAIGALDTFPPSPSPPFSPAHS